MADNTDTTTAGKLGTYRAALLEKGFTEQEIQPMVIEAARHLLNKSGLIV